MHPLINAIGLQDLPKAYVSTKYCALPLPCMQVAFDSSDPFQLVCFYFVITTFTTVGYGLLHSVLPLGKRN